MIELTRDVPHGGWPRNVRLTNRDVELIATTDIGPRILWYGRKGGTNVLFEDPEDAGRTEGEEWRSYGGHRLWHAPEAQPRTYAPDNLPVEAIWDAPRLELRARTEPSTGIEKALSLAVGEAGTEVEIHHRLTNRGVWAVRLAPWAITVLRPGGTAIVPNEPFVPFPEQLTPARPLVLWSYARLDDPRWSFAPGSIQLRQDPRARDPQKFGVRTSAGWGAYLNAGELFVKRFELRRCAEYPDFGCNFECFTDSRMIELESLGPLVTLEPGASVDHVETWSLTGLVGAPANAADIEREVFTRVRA